MPPDLRLLQAALMAGNPQMMVMRDGGLPRPLPHPNGITIPRSSVITPGMWPAARLGLGHNTTGFRPMPLRNAMPDRSRRNV